MEIVIFEECVLVNYIFQLLQGITWMRFFEAYWQLVRIQGYFCFELIGFRYYILLNNNQDFPDEKHEKETQINLYFDVFIF